MKISLPEIPPPLSACFTDPGRGKKGRVKTRRYRAWINEAAYRLKPYRGEFGEEPLRVIYRYGRPDRRRRDLGNLEKATSDILVSTGIITDDSQITDMRLLWDQIEGMEITIEKAASTTGDRIAGGQKGNE